MCNYLKIINIYTGAHLPRIRSLHANQVHQESPSLPKTPFANPMLASVQEEKEDKRGEYTSAP